MGAQVSARFLHRRGDADVGACDEILRLAGNRAPPVGGAAERPALSGVPAEAAKSGEDAIIYLSGEFFADALVLPAGMTAADVEVPLRN